MSNDMRVAIIGNMNNNSNNLIRYLIDRGLDCTLLFYENEADHFTPATDNIDGISYAHKTLDWGNYPNVYLTRPRQIKNDLAPFDYLIGSRLAPAYLQRAGLALDLFMPTGGDIWTVPVFVDWQIRNLIKFLFFSRSQRQGIAESGALFMDTTNVETETKIAPVVEGLERLIYPIPCLYLPDFESAALDRRIQQSEYLPLFQQLRSENDILLVHHVKHLWKPESVRKFDVLQEKGNDQIFHALKRFREHYPAIKLKLLTIAYGSDYEASQQLAAELGVADMVYWFNHVPRKELMIAIHLADAVIGEIARSWFSYGTIIEGMAMNKPVIHNRDDAYFAGRELYPMLNAHNADTVFKALCFLADRPDEAKAMGAAGGKWLRKVAVGRAIDDICRLVDEKAARLATANG